MNTNRTTRLVGLLVAVLMSVAINGTMLLKFDAIAQEATLVHSNVVMLDAVTVVAHQS